MTTDLLAKRVRTPAYIVLGLAVVVPWMDVLAGMWPWRFADVTWRFGAVGTLSGLAIPTAIALLGLLTLVLATEDSAPKLVLGVLLAITAVVMLCASGLFLLDAVQTRGHLPEDARRRFDYATASALAKLILIGATHTLMSWKALSGRRHGAKTAVESQLLVTASPSPLATRSAASRDSIQIA